MTTAKITPLCKPPGHCQWPVNYVPAIPGDRPCRRWGRFRVQAHLAGQKKFHVMRLCKQHANEWAFQQLVAK